MHSKGVTSTSIFDKILPVVFTAGLGAGHGWQKLSQRVRTHLRNAAQSVHNQILLQPLRKLRSCTCIAAQEFFHHEYVKTLPSTMAGTSRAFVDDNDSDPSPDNLAPVPDASASQD